ncbi:hypothetical protein [Streptomyces sp. NPDC003395]
MGSPRGPNGRAKLICDDHHLAAPWTLCPETDDLAVTQEWLASWTVSPYALGAMMFGALGNPAHDDCVRVVHRPPPGTRMLAMTVSFRRRWRRPPGLR